jgi:Winged helix DNA-binding domain
MRRQHLDPPDATRAADVVRRLCGVQAQVASAAALAVAVRQSEPSIEALPAAVSRRTLVRTWAMRGTLHVLPADAAASYLSLLASARIWEKKAWRKAFLSAAKMEKLTEAVTAALADGSELDRDELVAAVAEHSGDRALAEQIRSGWSAVLKPLAWQGLLCNGTARGARVTFAAPASRIRGWSGLPDPDEAARRVVPAYLAAYGPATLANFDQWLMRGATPKGQLRGWFAELGDAIAEVDVEGTPAYLRAEDVDGVAAAKPSTAVRLLPGFDQYVLGPGTGDQNVVPPQHRAEVSRTAGWISPVVVSGGRVAGTWKANGEIAVDLFGDRVPARRLAGEVARVRPLVRTG